MEYFLSKVAKGALPCVKLFRTDSLDSGTLSPPKLQLQEISQITKSHMASCK